MRHYFADCMGCTFCHDVCCSFGVDVDLANVARLLARRAELEAYLGVPAERWFTSDVQKDDDFPTGSYVRTAVVGGRCVFQQPPTRGCRIHSFCLENGIPYQELKPLVSSLFPITFDRGLLRVSNELVDSSLRCATPNTGRPAAADRTAYHAVREDLRYVFGDGLVAEMDAIEQSR